MRRLKTMLKWSGALAAALTLGLSAQADAAFTTAVAGYTQTGAAGGPTQSLGFDFKANSLIVLNELGVFSPVSTATASQTVYLYDLTTSTLITSTVVSGPYTAGFNYGGIAPTALNTTDTYSVYSLFNAAATNQYGTASSITFSPDLTIVPIGGQQTGYTQGLTPTPPVNGYAGILAVDFQYSPAVTVVPEPASVALMGLGMVGVVFVRRKMARRSA